MGKRKNHKEFWHADKTVEWNCKRKTCVGLLWFNANQIWCSLDWICSAGPACFRSRRLEILASHFLRYSSDPSVITKDYIKNSQLLLSLAKAIGRLYSSYKEIQHLAGYTSLIDEMHIVLLDLKRGVYKRIVRQKHAIEGSEDSK